LSSLAHQIATPGGRAFRVVVGLALAVAGLLLSTGWIAVVVVVLGAEIAVGGALNVCILCPIFGLPFAGRELA